MQPPASDNPPHPVNSCGLTTCHTSPESTTTCCGGLWVNCGTLWRSCHNPPHNGTLVVVTCGDHNSLPTTHHNSSTTLLTTCHILPQLTHTLPQPTHNFNIISNNSIQIGFILFDILVIVAFIVWLVHSPERGESGQIRM